MRVILGSLLLATACSNSGTKEDPSPTDDTDADLVDSDLPDTDSVDTDTDSVDTDSVDTDSVDTDVQDTDDENPVPVDHDQDGSPLGVDCDDTNPARTPGAEERCDGVDNDCDGDSADAGAVSWLPTFGAEVPLTRQFASGTPATPVGQTFTTSGTLLLCPGTHHVGISVENDATVTVRGTTTDAADVVLDTGPWTAVVASGGTSGVHLRDLTVVSGQSGLFVWADSANSLTNVVLRGCGVRTDGQDATLTLTDTELDGTTATNPGLVGQWTSVTLLRADVHHYTQGGLAFGTTGPINLLQSTVHDNQTPRSGGGVAIDLANAISPVTITLTGTVLERNHAALQGGGFDLRKPEALPVTLTGGHLRANTATIGGASVFLHQPGVDISDLTLSDHTATALMAFPTGTWSNLTCVDNAVDCVFTLGTAPRAWTLRDSTMHRNARTAITLSEADSLTFSNVDFGTGPDANGGDIWFESAFHDFVGVVSGTCTFGAGCD